MFRQRGIASQLLSFSLIIFDRFVAPTICSVLLVLYYLYVIVFMRMDTAYSDRVYAKKLRVW